MTLNTDNPKAPKRPRRMARPPCDEYVLQLKLPRKAALVEELLQQAAGASIDEMGAATGWQAHSCRAFLSGMRKKGRVLERAKREDGTTVYRIMPLAEVG
jgi:hypothetical protein